MEKNYVWTIQTRSAYCGTSSGKIDSTYKRLRWQVFAGIFFGYAAYYFVRANFDLAQPGLIQAGLYSKAELGVIGSAAGLAYGLSKFVMAGMSDRSNPRVFLPFGLLLSGLCMTLMGLFPWATSGIAIMWVMIFLNGWFQGMGWPPCGRTMVHWWSKSERGTIVSIWNTAHNIGGMVPGAMVLLASAISSVLTVLKRRRKMFGNNHYTSLVLLR